MCGQPVGFSVTTRFDCHTWRWRVSATASSRAAPRVQVNGWVPAAEPTKNGGSRAGRPGRGPAPLSPLSPPSKGFSVLPLNAGAGVAMSIPGRSTLPEGELEPGRGTSDDGNVRQQSHQVRVKQRRDPGRDEFQTQAGGWSLRFSNRHRSSDLGHRPSLFRERSHVHRPLLHAGLPCLTPPARLRPPGVFGSRYSTLRPAPMHPRDFRDPMTAPTSPGSARIRLPQRDDASSLVCAKPPGKMW